MMKSALPDLLRTLTASVMLCASSAAIAIEAGRPALTPPPTAVSSGNIVQVISSLLLVLVAILAVAWLLKRMNIAQQGTGNLLKVVGSVAIGQRERVVLVEVDDTWLLVGVGPGQIRTLHTMAKTEDWQSGSPDLATSDNKFARMLSAMIKRRPSEENRNAA
ncbi:MAG: flagellar biosynthetic protein FliO [Gallionella sp.]|nr:flagellar biosynthetic protein FliO [Gallionella sp.]MDP1594633.1 flagellar biosynthetic protein FliO [Gallionella sp.]MDP1941656.1 flagellar biosynthetic protein FliO [Gallionella sp.]